MRISLLFITSLLLFAWSCAGEGEAGVVASADQSYESATELTAKSDVDDDRNNEQPTERKLIKNGFINFETKSVTETQNQIVDLVTSKNGYLSNQDQYEYDDRIRYKIEARIPANQFDDFFQQVNNIAHRVDNQNVTVQDVTQEFIDVESRIKTKKELEERYLGLLTKAKTVEEMLDIERELGTLSGDIESMQGRLQYLQNQTSYSTVTVQFYQVTGRGFGFASKFTKAFANGWRALLSFIIGLVTMWPFLIILTLIIFLLRRSRLLKKKKTVE